MPKFAKSKVKDGTVPLNVRIPIGLDDQLEEHCQKYAVSKASAVRVAIHNLLDEHKQNKQIAEERSSIVEVVENIETTLEAVGRLAKMVKRK